MNDSFLVLAPPSVFVCVVHRRGTPAPWPSPSSLHPSWAQMCNILPFTTCMHDKCTYTHIYMHNTKADESQPHSAECQTALSPFTQSQQVGAFKHTTNGRPEPHAGSHDLLMWWSLPSAYNFNSGISRLWLTHTIWPTVERQNKPQCVMAAPFSPCRAWILKTLPKQIFLPWVSTQSLCWPTYTIPWQPGICCGAVWNVCRGWYGMGVTQLHPLGPVFTDVLLIFVPLSFHTQPRRLRNQSRRYVAL